MQWKKKICVASNFYEEPARLSQKIKVQNAEF